MSERSDSEWHAFIGQKQRQVLSEPNCSQPGPLSYIFSPGDPLFPSTIDHTLLKQEATPSQVDALCDDALKYGFKVR